MGLLKVFDVTVPPYACTTQMAEISPRSSPPPMAYLAAWVKATTSLMGM